MYRRQLRILFPSFLFLLWCGLCVFAFTARAQEEPPPGPDSHETGQGPHGHLFGDWGGERTRLLERGVKFDFHYIGDSLWGIERTEERFAGWNRFRWTVDIDFGALTGCRVVLPMRCAVGRAEDVWGPSRSCSPKRDVQPNSAAWIPGGSRSAAERTHHNRVGRLRSDYRAPALHGVRHLQPMGYALGNLFNPRVVSSYQRRRWKSAGTAHLCYVKSMVMAAVASPFHKSPGLVPQFNGIVSAGGVGFTRGENARRRCKTFADDEEGRKGYWRYQFGAPQSGLIADQCDTAVKLSPVDGVSSSGTRRKVWMTFA
jgi:hypothetical protein